MSQCHRCGWVIWHLECINPKCREAYECPGCHESGPNGHYDGRTWCQAIGGTPPADQSGEDA